MPPNISVEPTAVTLSGFTGYVIRPLTERTPPNQGVQLTAYSLRYASASGSS